MRINKKIIIILTVLLLLISLIVIFIIIKNKNGNRSSNDVYSAYTDEYLKDYLNTASNIFNEKTYETIKENEINSLIIYQLLLENNKTDADIKSFVYQYFGINNYSLKTKTYRTIINDEINIIMSNNYYKAQFITKNNYKQTTIYSKKEIVNDYLMVIYDNVKETDNSHNTQKIGELKFYLKLENDNLVIKKIVYDDVLNYKDVSKDFLKDMEIYLEKVVKHFYKESVYNFNDDTINHFLVKQYLNYGNRASIQTIKDVAFNLFRKEDYLLVEGEYESPYGSTYTVKITNGLYRSTLIEGNSHMYKNTVKKVLQLGDNYVVIVDCEDIVNLDKSEYKKIGESKIYLLKEDGHYIIQKIIYNNIT